MIVERISVRYGELRSTGYPTFSNKRYEIEISAQLQAGETAEQVRLALAQSATQEVKRFFGDTVITGDPMHSPRPQDVPF